MKTKIQNGKMVTCEPLGTIFEIDDFCIKSYLKEPIVVYKNLVAFIHYKNNNHSVVVVNVNTKEYHYVFSCGQFVFEGIMGDPMYVDSIKFLNDKKLQIKFGVCGRKTVRKKTIDLEKHFK